MPQVNLSSYIPQQPCAILSPDANTRWRCPSPATPQTDRICLLLPRSFLRHEIQKSISPEIFSQRRHPQHHRPREYSSCSVTNNNESRNKSNRESSDVARERHPNSFRLSSLETPPPFKPVCVCPSDKRRLHAFVLCVKIVLTYSTSLFPFCSRLGSTRTRIGSAGYFTFV